MGLNRGPGPRLGLALTVSLTVHAVLWWWQPVEPPTAPSPGSPALQVSLLSVASEPNPDDGIKAPSPLENTATPEPVAATGSTAKSPPEPLAEPAPPPPAVTPASEGPETVESEPLEQPETPPEPVESAPVEPESPTAQPEPRPAPPPAATTRTTQADPSRAERREVPRTATETGRVAPQADSRSASSTNSTADAAPEPARILSNPKPAYPRQARRRGLEGRVLLEVEVQADGRPGRIDIVASSGHSILDQAALEGLRQWRFQPARRGGRSVDATLRVPVSFRLN